MKQARTIPKYMRGLSFRIISGTIFLLLLFGAIQSWVGYARFTASLTGEYNESAFRTAETAEILIDGDRIEEYLATDGKGAGYAEMRSRLNLLCQKQDVTLIYVIVPVDDTYAAIRTVVSVANAKSGYDPWEIGYIHQTTNEEYLNVYRDIYENGLKRGSVLRTNSLGGREPHITSLIPVDNSSGEVAAIVCVQRPMEELVAGRRRFLLHVVVATALLAIASSCSAYFFLREQFVRPMHIVTREAERFARESCRANEDVLAGLSEISEIDTLAASIAQMEKDTLDYIDRLTKMTAENKRIGTELAIARGIQAAVLPDDFPPFAGRKTFDIYASMAPAKEVGGDFYDFFLIDDDHIGLVIADVAGKGVPAALFMMISKLLIKLRAYSGGDLGDMLADVNNTLCERNKMELFVTVWFAVIELSTGEGRAVNAGHEYPAVRRAGGEYELLKSKHSVPLAAMEGMHYKEHTFRMCPGDSFVVYTDGVTEATDADDTLFGETRLTAALNEAPEASPEEAVAAVRRSIDAFVGDAEQFDDITMLAFRYIGH